MRVEDVVYALNNARNTADVKVELDTGYSVQEYKITDIRCIFSVNENPITACPGSLLESVIIRCSSMPKETEEERE